MDLTAPLASSELLLRIIQCVFTTLLLISGLLSLLLQQ